jgi:hypothetical protein
MEVGFTEKKENEKESPIGNGVDSHRGTGGMVSKGHRNYAFRRQTIQQRAGYLDSSVQSYRCAKRNELRD